jgi:hypothetical protein
MLGLRQRVVAQVRQPALHVPVERDRVDPDAVVQAVAVPVADAAQLEDHGPDPQPPAGAQERLLSTVEQNVAVLDRAGDLDPPFQPLVAQPGGW